MTATATTAEATPNYSGQLTAGEYDVITMNSEADAITVFNMDGSARIDYTTDGTLPVVGGAPGTARSLPAVICSDFNAQIEHELPVVVTLISSGTPEYVILNGA